MEAGMRFGMLGTGVVGRTLAAKLVDVGHEVTMGSRRDGNDAALRWAESAGERGRQGTFAEAAKFGEIVVNATAGAASLSALGMAGAANLEGKVLIDVANAIAPDTGFPPQLAVCNNDSLAEQIQRAYPASRVVKTLNTVTADVMVNPRMLGEPHTIFLSGNDTSAKDDVGRVLQSFGWDQAEIFDLGDISTARGPEMYLALWLRLFVAAGTPHLNVRLVRRTS
jgi:8-hydroxy-5-deazaflavin:NADPH oxidoreductase